MRVPLNQYELYTYPDPNRHVYVYVSGMHDESTCAVVPRVPLVVFTGNLYNRVATWHSPLSDCVPNGNSGKLARSGVWPLLQVYLSTGPIRQVLI